jgi:4'-phosphopantetheinyl transferase EntD
MLAQIVPAGIAIAEEFGDLDSVTLFPAEEAALANAVPRRRRAFATGRACARRALSELGVAASAISRGERGEPCWPEGIVGSITHCEGYRAAAVAWAREWRCMGIDAEPHGPLPRGVLARIALAREQRWLGSLAAEHPAVCWDRLLFSAKEAVYKAVYPLTGERLQFKDVPIAFDTQCNFKAYLPAHEMRKSAQERVPPATLHGRWLVRDGLLLTAIAIPA